MTQNATSRLRLSVLDQSPIAEGSTLGGALRNSIDLAVLAEAMGNHRYWLAKHHGSPGFGRMSPEILIGPIAAATSRIRIGSGGVMLPHYSPYKVAESFSMLASLFRSNWSRETLIELSAFDSRSS
jgi:luciferase family oxidoreductase group 1